MRLCYKFPYFSPKKKHYEAAWYEQFFEIAYHDNYGFNTLLLTRSLTYPKSTNNNAQYQK